MWLGFATGIGIGIGFGTGTVTSIVFRTQFLRGVASIAIEFSTAIAFGFGLGFAFAFRCGVGTSVGLVAFAHGVVGAIRFDFVAVLRRQPQLQYYCTFVSFFRRVFCWLGTKRCWTSVCVLKSVLGTRESMTRFKMKDRSNGVKWWNWSWNGMDLNGIHSASCQGFPSDRE